MQFNEIVDKDGVEKVSSITNISVANLEYLVAEDFENLNRVKSLGFLLILEREYKDIDVSALRERVKLYFEEHKPADENVVMISQDRIGENGFSFFKWFIVFALLAGGYYFYAQGKLDGLVKNIEDKKDFFDDNKALESNVTDAEAKNVSVQRDNKAEPIAIATPIAPTEKKISLNGEMSKSDLNSTIITANEANNSQNGINSVVSKVLEVSEAQKSAESVVQEVVEDAEVVVEQTVESVVSETETVVAVSAISTITVNPTRGMLWYGFINLDTKKRREFMKKVSTPFDIKDGRWLLVTGHGYVDIVSDLETIELADRNKHYFYIDSTEIRTLSRKEFRAMNGRRGW